MTADLSEGETGSRLQKRSILEVRPKGDVDVGSSASREAFKGSKRKDGKDVDTDRCESVLVLGDKESNLAGTANFTAGFGGSSSDHPRSRDPDEYGVTGKNKKLLKAKGLHPQPIARACTQIEDLSPEENRDEETEDDFVQGDGAIVEVGLKVSPPQQQPQLQQSQRSREDKQSSHHVPPPEPLPQPPTLTVGWESFLPQRNIRVLLAEDDDSTRQVVGALLRNCHYEVSSAANGMQAWEMLEDPSNHFDLVLTDVVMPCLSGVGLLTRIMSHEAGKRIPVIMMSSHDSLDIVFRCLSKGAADFLVKPVRKNELKNLWQHVWRCQSSSGSGSGRSGSGSGNGKVGRPKSRVGSGNDSGSNDGSDDNSSGLNVRGGSDNGSGTQAVPHVNHKQIRDHIETDEGQATSLEKISNQQMGQDLEMATRRPGTPQMEKAHDENCQNVDRAIRDNSLSTSGNSANQLEKGYNSGDANSGGSSAKAIDLIGGIACQHKGDDEGVESGDGAEGIDRGASNSPVTDKCVSSSNSPPMLELSLKRPRGEDDSNGEEKRLLRHSGGSAFSRYSTNGTTIQQIPSGGPLSLCGYPMGNGYGALCPGAGPLGPGNSGQVQFSVPIDRIGSSKGSAEASNSLPLHAHMSPKGNGQDLGSSRAGSSTPEGYSQHVKEEAISGQGLSVPISLPPRGMMYDGVSATYGSSMHQVFYTQSATPPWANTTTHLSDRGEVFDHPPYREHGSHISHHRLHHHQHQPPHHSHLQQPLLHSQQGEQIVTDQGSGGPQGSSNMAGSIQDGNAGQSGSSNGYGSTGNGNGSVNGSGSGSGSNNMSNQNGQGCGVANATQNVDCGGNNSGSGTPGVVGDENRFSRREAALNKFRQKRKERCFEKKVRYQSRKRLAEQRPRVRGQFVRQAVFDSNVVNDMTD